MHSIRIIGPGRAGTSLAAALSARGWAFAGFLGRHDELARAAEGVDLLVIATPDDAVTEVAAAVVPSPGTTVAHLSGSLGLDALAPHPLRATVHPLVPLPNGEVGAARLGSGVTFAVAGAPLGRDMVTSLGGRMVEVADADRAAYHAAACIAANHVVALLGQVERVAASVGLDLESFLPLTRAAVDDVAALGAGAALDRPRPPGRLGHPQPPPRRPARVRARRLSGGRGPGDPAGPGGGPSAGAAGRHRAGADRRHSAGAAGRGVGAATVEVVESVAACRDLLDRARAAGRVVGLVPTMGALHHGHTSLLDRARAECDVVAVSIFVNPLQFGDAEDIARYPRTLERDLRVCAASGADVVFVPSVDEMYPSWPDAPSTTVTVRGVSEAWEGASRPGHFDGVATVVAKLFAMAGPCRAYFGLKDFQQLAVVRRMARELSLPVEVVGCPIVREPDGLALSSRNVRLSASERRGRHRALAGAGRRPGRAGGRRALGRRGRPGDARRGRRRAAGAARLCRRGRRRHPRGGGHRRRRRGRTGSLRLLIAAQVGPVRLIDNSAA